MRERREKGGEGGEGGEGEVEYMHVGYADV